MPRIGDVGYDASDDCYEYEDYDTEDDAEEEDEEDEDSPDPLGLRRCKKRKKGKAVAPTRASELFNLIRVKFGSSFCSCGGEHNLPGDSYWHIHSEDVSKYTGASGHGCHRRPYVEVESEARLYANHAETVFTAGHDETDDWSGATKYGPDIPYEGKSNAQLVAAIKAQLMRAGKAAFDLGWRNCPDCDYQFKGICECKLEDLRENPPEEAEDWNY